MCIMYACPKKLFLLFNVMMIMEIACFMLLIALWDYKEYDDELLFLFFFNCIQELYYECIIWHFPLRRFLPGLSLISLVVFNQFRPK